MEKKTYSIKREKWKNGYWIVERDNKGKRTSWKKWKKDKILNQKNKNIVKNKRKNEHYKKTQKITIKHKKKLTPWEKLKKMEKEIKKFPTILSITKEIKKQGVIKFNPNIKEQNTINKSKLIKQYRKILKTKVKAEKIDEIIIHRKKTLKNRLAVRINIYTERGFIGSIEIGGVLLEKEKDIYNYWNGLYIDSDNFEILAEQFRQLINNPKIYVISKAPGKNAGTVTKVKTGWSFA